MIPAKTGTLVAVGPVAPGSVSVAHPRSCINCAHCWHHESNIGEVESDGPSGWVCDGKAGVQNLRSFPFRTEQPCFSPNTKV